MLQYQIRPIDQWPGEITRDRRWSPFKATWPSTLDLLERELDHLRGKEIVLQIDVGMNDIKNDGTLRAEPASPKVILSFESKHGPLSYPCDAFSQWQGNVRAIALGLEALRRVERYGIAGRAEQYKGWSKLGGPGVVLGEFANAQEAAAFLRSVGGGDVAVVLKDPQLMEQCYRRACVATHPDHFPQHVATFKRVQAAKEFLDRHFKR
jgi:hypothetical protein